ncbi:DUF397 domain-containing protein [Dactylosporangium aurantiacum]|nr:DUF397 domain-containing protein [Dactylosporangium aurantiacum]MDG6107580.1 DUF397 domain-containing protein [Dactylosporangium aurantiacum]
MIWRKSRSCANAACIEVARDDARFLVRDSKDPDGARLAFTPQDWSLFIGAVCALDRSRE